MRFFVKMPLTTGDTLRLPDGVAHHWGKVLRAKVGETAVLFNGQGGEYTATLTHIDKKGASVTIGQHNPASRTLPYRVCLAQAMSKGERMDYTIQKACEMGVSAIQLIISERSERLRYERDHKKLSHWQSVAISACEQCGLNIIPQILPPITLTEYVRSCTDELKLILSPSDDGECYVPSSLPDGVSLLVGSEGGFSADEVALAHECGFLSWTLGERILRTETAGVVAMASLAMIGALSAMGAHGHITQK